MIRIRKRQEPKSWSEYRLSTPGANFDAAPKADLRKALLEEQGYICCYCMGRIEESSTRIEHRRPREKYINEQFDYRNLMAACLGGEGFESIRHHCDKRKHNHEISLDPTDSTKDIERKLRYREASGEIDSDDPDVRHDLTEILGLNLEHLKLARREILDGFKKGFERKHKGDWSAGIIERELKKWSDVPANGKHHPYAGIVVHYLRKRMARLDSMR